MITPCLFDPRFGARCVLDACAMLVIRPEGTSGDDSAIQVQVGVPEDNAEDVKTLRGTISPGRGRSGAQPGAIGGTIPVDLGQTGG